MNYIHWFSEIGAGKINIVGGKGANLGELVRGGLPVPPGFCLSAYAYRDFVQSTGLNDQIAATLDAADLEDAAQLTAASAEIRGYFHQLGVPETMAGELKEGYRKLARDVGIDPGAVLGVAVRSSATAEDLPDASFAGQQDTFLNIRGEEALVECVMKCWSSLWTARAIRYRLEHGFDHSKVYLSAVVQAMIESEVAGVLFQANPVTNSPEEAVINASWGLGESVVSGGVTPDTFTVNKATGEILSREIGTKEISIEYAASGGVVELEVAPERRAIASLSDDHVHDLMALGNKVEAYYDAPQDIEWGFRDGRFYLLQARPITTLEVDEFNRSMFIEIFPDPLSPVFLSVIQPMFESMLEFTFEAMGFDAADGFDSIGLYYSQPYFNRRYIAGSLEALRPATRDRLVTQIVNPFGRHERGMAGELSPAFLGMVARILRFMVRFPAQLPGLIETYRSEVDAVNAMEVEGLSDLEIVQGVKQLVFGSASTLLNYDFLMITVIGITYQMLGTLLEPYFEEGTEEIRSKLISGVTGNVTMETNLRMWDLAQNAKASPEVHRLLAEHSASEFLERARGSEAGRAFLEEMDGFLAVYGHREIRMDILYPTWGEDPEPLLSFLRMYLDADDSQSPHKQQARLVKQREEIVAEVRDHLWGDLRGRLVAWPLFRWVLNHTQAHTRERDTMHFELTRIFPPFRKLFRELGNRWAAAGVLDNPEDVFFLSLDDMTALAESPRPMQAEITERRRAFETNKARPWPSIIRGRQEIFEDDGHAPAQDVPEGAFGGVAGSAGRVTGTARVIRGPEEFSKLRNGEILVAPLTNPVWTPLFAIAGGIVTEVGGILSHGAIVAREYGIPAVLSVAGITRRVEDGQAITVDGNGGYVQLEPPLMD